MSNFNISGAKRALRPLALSQMIVNRIETSQIIVHFSSSSCAQTSVNSTPEMSPDWHRLLPLPASIHLSVFQERSFIIPNSLGVLVT